MLNWEKLVSLQRQLDERIIREKGLEGKDLLSNKILALQVELGELANEWQMFKHWKNNPQPKPGMLEEYVDCLHFILSIGLDLKATYIHFCVYDTGDIVQKFLRIFELLSELSLSRFSESTGFQLLTYELIVGHFIGLGKMLGFTWEQIEEEYLKKNKINHERQRTGY